MSLFEVFPEKLGVIVVGLIEFVSESLSSPSSTVISATFVKIVPSVNSPVTSHSNWITPYFKSLFVLLNAGITVPDK